MARVEWSDEAAQQLDLIVAYIELFDAAAAERLAGGLIEAAQSLEHFPNRGRPAAHGCRELLTIRPYIIRYQVYGDQVTILGVRHGARRSPEEERRKS